MKTSKTFKVLFWQNVAKRKGLEAPIYARITVSGRRVEISLGKFYPIEFWDNKMSRGVGRTIETRELNFFLDNVKIEISDAYLQKSVIVYHPRRIKEDHPCRVKVSHLRRTKVNH